MLDMNVINMTNTFNAYITAMSSCITTTTKRTVLKKRAPEKLEFWNPMVSLADVRC